MISQGGPPDDDDNDGGGYGRPPRTTRFAKGQSGYPAGRPRGRHREAPYETVLGQMVTIREAGVERRVTATEAFLLHLSKRGLQRDGAAARATGPDRAGQGEFQHSIALSGGSSARLWQLEASHLH